MGNRLTAIRAMVRSRARALMNAALRATDSTVVVVGLAIFVYGVSMISIPAATMTAGVLITAIGVGRYRA